MDDPFFIQAEDKFYEKSMSPKVLRVINKQTGRTTVRVDRKIRALQAGKRISKTGHVYWETRKNRSDMTPKKKI